MPFHAPTNASFLVNEPSALSSSNDARIQVDSPHIFFNKHHHNISIVIACDWYSKSGLQEDLIVTAVLGSPWKKQGTFEDAKCSQCCKLGSPVVGLQFSGKSQTKDGKECAFNFAATSRCSSSRTHMGCSVILVVSGIPGLKPMLSAPISLQARNRGSKTQKRSSQKSTLPPALFPAPLTPSYCTPHPHTCLLLTNDQNYEDACSIPGIDDVPKVLPVIDSRSGITKLKSDVVAVSSVITTTCLPSSAFLQGPQQVIMQITSETIFWIVYTPFGDLIHQMLPEILGDARFFVYQVSEKTYLVGTRADSVQNAAVTGHSLAMYARFGNPYGYDLFMPNPYAQIVGWASNLFY